MSALAAIAETVAAQGFAALRPIGAALTVAASAALGIRASLAISKEIRTIDGLILMLSALKREISEHFTPLEAALALAGKAGASDFVSRVLERLKASGGAGFGDIWNEESLALGGSVGDALAPLAPVLGRYSAAEQADALERAIERLSALKNTSEDRKAKSGKMFITFGFCGGITAVLLLF